MSRFCNYCNIEHPENEFLIIKSKSKLADGTKKLYISYICKKKDKQIKEKSNENNKLYYKNNKEAIDQKHREHYQKNKDKKKQYEEENKEKIAEQQKKYRENNKEKIAEKNKKYRKENGEKINATAKSSRQTYEGTINQLVKTRIHYNKKDGFDCDLDNNYVKQLIEKCDSKCIYCEHSLEIKCDSGSLSQISIDRIDSNKPYQKDNIQLTCLFCNLAKNSSSDSLYKAFVDALRGKKYNSEDMEIKSHIGQLVNSCHVFDKRNNFPVHESITSKQVRQLQIKQNNKCAVSELEFINAKQQRFPFQMSIDRIDNSKGHTLDNCQLVCLAVQYGKLDKSNDAVIQYINEIKQV